MKCVNKSPRTLATDIADTDHSWKSFLDSVLFPAVLDLCYISQHADVSVFVNAVAVHRREDRLAVVYVFKVVPDDTVDRFAVVLAHVATVDHIDYLWAISWPSSAAARKRPLIVCALETHPASVRRTPTMVYCEKVCKHPQSVAAAAPPLQCQIV
jgi:hypothetical protein